MTAADPVPVPQPPGDEVATAVEQIVAILGPLTPGQRGEVLEAVMFKATGGVRYEQTADGPRVTFHDPVLPAAAPGVSQATSVEHDGGGPKYNQRYPWRTRCTTCGWSDTFATEAEASAWARTHDGHHVLFDRPSPSPAMRLPDPPKACPTGTRVELDAPASPPVSRTEPR